MRNEAGLDHLLIMVGVADKAVQRFDALGQPRLHVLPLMGRNDAGNQVEGDQTLGTCAAFVLVAIDRKGDAHAAEHNFCLGTAGAQILLRLLAQPLRIVQIVVSHGATFGGRVQIHLIECAHSVLSISDTAHACEPLVSV